MEKRKNSILRKWWQVALVVVFLLSVRGIHAQDLHFSQFNKNPLLLNPALTGHIEGTYRIHLHFRNQWLNLAENGVFNTPAAAFDINLGMKNTYSSLGIGIVIAKDYSGSGAFEQLTGLVSLSYHLSLDAYERYFLSFGIQGGFFQKRLDFTRLTFESQFDGIQIDPTMNSMESFIRDEVVQPNFRAGITWSSYFGERFKVIVGGAYINIVEPDESFIERNPLPSRLAIHFDLEIGLGSRFDVAFQGLYMKQAEAQQTNAGLLLKYSLPSDYSFSLGGFLRIQDAAIGVVGIGIKGVEINFSYDYTISELSVVNDGVGAMELSITYTGQIKKVEKPAMPAIRFF